MGGVACHGNGRHRAKQLLAESGHLRGHVAQHRWRIVVARPGDFLPPKQQGRPFSQGGRDLLMQLIAQIETRHRPKIVGLITRIAHLQRLNRGNQFCAESLGNPGLNDKALRGGANLSGVLIAANHRGFDRFVEVGIIEDDKRIGTAQFKNAFLQRRTGLGANRLPGAHAAG